MKNLTVEHFQEIEKFMNGICRDESLFTECPNTDPLLEGKTIRREFNARLVHDILCELIDDVDYYKQRLSLSNALIRELHTETDGLKEELDRLKEVAYRMGNLQKYKEQKLKE